jgi:hypothetical protein
MSRSENNISFFSPAQKKTKYDFYVAWLSLWSMTAWCLSRVWTVSWEDLLSVCLSWEKLCLNLKQNVSSVNYIFKISVLYWYSIAKKAFQTKIGVSILWKIRSIANLGNSSKIHNFPIKHKTSSACIINSFSQNGKAHVSWIHVERYKFGFTEIRRSRCTGDL